MISLFSILLLSFLDKKKEPSDRWLFDFLICSSSMPQKTIYKISNFIKKQIDYF